MQAGFSKLLAREPKKLAPIAPSTSRWSQLRPKVSVSPATTLPPLSTTGFLIEEPMDRIAAFGGLIMPLKKSIPYIPRFVTVKVDPPLPQGVIFCF